MSGHLSPAEIATRERIAAQVAKEVDAFDEIVALSHSLRELYERVDDTQDYAMESVVGRDLCDAIDALVAMKREHMAS